MTRAIVEVLKNRQVGYLESMKRITNCLHLGISASLGICLLLGPSECCPAEEATVPEEQLEFFEARIRPILVEHCYDCHQSGATSEGGLALDYADGLRRGGQSGSVVDVKSPSNSLLLRVMRHDIENLEMPQGGDRLSDSVIEDFQRWIEMGAPDPRRSPPNGDTTSFTTSWQQTLQERKQWWSFQPIADPPVPQVQDESWSSQPIDRWVLSRLESAGLKPTTRADRRTRIRRLSFVLRGLPPTDEEIAQFLADDTPQAWEHLVDRFLADEAFGEYWARHWMDLVRYAETHGSEGDPAVPFAWKYRDYLIRAFNQDVPYSQLLREHIAGDLLHEPRINEQLDINESAIGTAHWRMCFHGFAPTDALDEKVRFVDDQINVFSKTFLGLTISCARCHNHKFDPISQADYYAMFGILDSTRPGILDIHPSEIQYQHQESLAQLRSNLRKRLAQSWSETSSLIAERLLQQLEQASAEQLADPQHLLHPFALLASGKLTALEEDRESETLQVPEQARHWDLATSADLKDWQVYGNGTAHNPAAPGELIVNNSPMPSYSLLPSGVYSHLLSTRHRNILASPDVHLDGNYELWVQVAGDEQAMLRYVVQDYPRNGTVYPVLTLNDGQWRWQRYDLTYWNGDVIHIELTTAADSAVLAKDVERSWFGVRHVVIAPQGTFSPPADPQPWRAVFKNGNSANIESTDALARQYSETFSKALNDWQSGQATDEQVRLLSSGITTGLLALNDEHASKVHSLLTAYQETEQDIPLPNRVPGLLEAEVADHPLFIRGNHRQPGAVVPRRFLEAIDTTPYDAAHSGRLALADDLLRDDNPLTSRVAVNRLWHYLFGAGLVRSVDNFGQLGESPSHPELLDHLATRFRQHGWSVKSMIREILLTETWQLDSTPSPLAKQIDPENRLLSHANLRRMEAEVLRDSLLAVSGQLDRTIYGPPVGTGTASPRRSIYLSVLRNSLNPLLEVFDFPTPAATKGRRDSTNVPAQSLTLLNDPFVIRTAKLFSQQTASIADPETRIVQLFSTALGRPPTETEIQSAQAYLQQLQRQYEQLKTHRAALLASLEDHQSKLSSKLDPARDKLIQHRESTADSKQVIVPPVAQWRFDDSFQDDVGSLHGTAHGKARLDGGALHVQGNGYVATAPLPINLRAKTLEVVVQLDTLDQRGGGVMTVQDLSGVVFDAIVFGEQQPQHWLAGSDHFSRTQSFQGTAETEAAVTPIHLTITYAEDGHIRAFRNGVPYGNTYQSSGPVTFQAEQSRVLFGLRHGSPGGNRLLSGRIFEARLYDRALQPKEIEALAQGNRSFVSEQEVLDSLSESAREEVQRIRAQIQQIREEEQQLGPPASAGQEWADLAHAILNLKEFLYYR